MVFYLEYFELQPLFFIASILFFLSITISLIYKEHYIDNIFLIVALTNLAMIFALFSNFEIGIIAFFILVLILFIYCYVLISAKKKIQDSNI